MDVLRTHHRFLRPESESAETYEAQVARKYYDSLYKEVRRMLMQYAIANLKHYRTRGIALRWRTEDEVLDGIGQFTCANQRCAWHAEPDARTKLGTYEVPFEYQEPGDGGAVEKKQALVKVGVCAYAGCAVCGMCREAALSVEARRARRPRAAGPCAHARRVVPP